MGSIAAWVSRLSTSLQRSGQMRLRHQHLSLLSWVDGICVCGAPGPAMSATAAKLAGVEGVRAAARALWRCAAQRVEHWRVMAHVNACRTHYWTRSQKPVSNDDVKRNTSLLLGRPSSRCLPEHVLHEALASESS